MSDAVRRSLRTFVQAFLGSIITSGVLSATQESGVVDWSALKKVAVSALAAAVIALLTFVQNSLEDHTTVPALLKAPASEGLNPEPDPEPPAPAKRAARARKATKKAAVPRRR
jgi:hypothetical protein